MTLDVPRRHPLQYGTTYTARVTFGDPPDDCEAGRRYTFVNAIYSHYDACIEMQFKDADSGKYSRYFWSFQEADDLMEQFFAIEPPLPRPR